MKFFNRKLAGVIAALGAVGALGLVAASPAAANVGGGNVQVTWSIPGWPPEGLSDVSFPMTVAPTTSRQPGTYYAQLFNFTDSTHVGYTGLQPRNDLSGSERIRGVFSSFMPGTVTDHPNCTNGADGGPGVSCGLEFDAVYGRTYDMRVERTAPQKWTGTAVDTVTGAEVEIGSWTVPALGGLKGTRTSGFVEYYSSVAQCSQMPFIDVTFGAPHTSRAGLTGNVGFSMEYGDCVGEGALTHSTVGSAVRVTRGFVQPPLAAAVSLNTGVNNRCLDVPSSKWENGTVVAMWSCNYNNNQRWSFTSTGQLWSNKTCLQTQTANPAPGDRVVIQDCDDSPGQLWDYVDGAIVARTSGLCLQLDPGNAWAVDLGTCSGSAGQKWRAMSGANQPVATEPSASQTRSTTLREGEAGTLQLTLNGGAVTSSSRLTLTAPSGTTFTGDVMYSNWTGGLPFTGELSDGGRTLTVSLAMLPEVADDDLIPFAVVQYTVSLRANDDLALKGPVDDGTWRAGPLSGSLVYQADGVTPTDVTDPDPDDVVDVPVIDPLFALAGAGGLAIFAAVRALMTARRRGRRIVS